MPIYRFIEPRLGRRYMHEWRGRAMGVGSVLFGLIIVATVGLALLDNSAEPFLHKMLQGLWNAVNLVTTLGDFSDFDLRQKTFMLAAMLVAMVTGAYGVSQLTGILTSPEVLAYRENRRMDRKLNELSGHAVVVGYTGLGATLAQSLTADGRKVVVVAGDADSASLASGDGHLVVQTDVNQIDDAIATARVNTASAVYVATGDDHRNLAVTLIARSLHPTVRIVVSVHNARVDKLLRQGGASDVVIVDDVLARAMMARPAA
jgi:hypothetical protein